MSRNHIPTIDKKYIKYKANSILEVLKLWKIRTVYSAICKRLTEVKNGHGDGLTKWKPCFSALNNFERLSLIVIIFFLISKAIGKRNYQINKNKIKIFK